MARQVTDIPIAMALSMKNRAYSFTGWCFSACLNVHCRFPMNATMVAHVTEMIFAVRGLSMVSFSRLNSPMSVMKASMPTVPNFASFLVRVW